MCIGYMFSSVCAGTHWFINSFKRRNQYSCYRVTRDRELQGRWAKILGMENAQKSSKKASSDERVESVGQEERMINPREGHSRQEDS